MPSVYTIATIEPDLLEDEKRKDAAGLIALEHEIPGEVSSYKVNLGGMTGVSFVLEDTGGNKHIVTFDQRTGIQPSFIESLLEDDDTIAVSEDYEEGIIDEDGTLTKTKEQFLTGLNTIDKKYFVKIGKDSGYLRGVIMLYTDYQKLKAKDKNGVLTIVPMAYNNND